MEIYSIHHQAFVLSNEQKKGVTYIPVYYILFFEPDNAVVGEF